MKVRLLFAAGAMGLLLAFGAVTGACKNGGGGGALTLEEYFQQLDELDDEFETRSNEIDSTIESLSDEEFLEQAPELLGEQADLVEEFLDGLEDLDAPEEAAALQDEALSAGREVVELFRGLVEDIDAAETVDDVFAVFDQEDFNAAIDRFDQVCLDAEQLAADNGITIDLNCEDEGTDGADGGALEDYFQQLDELENEFRVSGDAADAAFSALEDTAPVSDAVAILEDAVAGIDEFVAGLEGLDAPGDAKPFHEETIGWFGVVSELLHDAIDNAGQYATLDELFAIFNDPELTTASDSLDGACAALQGVADSNGIAVDLSCEE